MESERRRALIVGDGVTFDVVKALQASLKKQGWLALSAVGSATPITHTEDDAAWYRKIMQRSIRNKRYNLIMICGAALTADLAGVLAAANDSGARIINRSTRQSALDMLIRQFKTAHPAHAAQ